MKNVFSYPYGTVFTGKEIKEFLLAWQKKGNSLYRMKQFLNCKDDRLYKMSYETTPSGGNPIKYRTFIRIDSVQLKHRKDILMEKKGFYYSVEPIKKEVSEEKFLHFINNYPRKLERDVTGICDPPAISYNDFELADRWPYSVVASGHLWSDNPDDYFYCPKEERKYTIMENFEEVFASRTGNKTI